VSTQTREYFNVKPVRTTYSAPATYARSSVGEIKINEQGQVIGLTALRRVKPASAITTYSLLTGNGEIVEIPIKASSLAEQRQLDVLFGRKGVQTLTEEQQLSVANVQSEKFLKSRIGKNSKEIFMDLQELPKGKRMTRGVGVGISTPILETPEATWVRFKTSGRDITFPFSKPRRFQVTQGIAVVPKDLITFEETTASGVNFIKRVVPKAPKEIIKKQVMDIGVKEVNKLPPKVFKNVPAKPSAVPEPSVIKTTSASVAAASVIFKEVSAVKQEAITQPTYFEGTKSADMLQTISLEQNAFKLIDKTVPNLGEVSISIEQQQQTEETRQQERQQQQQRQEQQQRQRQEQRQIFSELTTQTARTTFSEISRPIQPIPNVMITKFKGKGKSILDKVKEAYNVVVFKGGKEQIIGKNLPMGRAKKLGVKNVLSTLRASFKLKSAGTTYMEDIPYEVPSSTFRMSKIEKGRYVQKKNLRFGARPETKEAQMFRKIKKGKIKWF
jgi:hypothetical protein